MWAEVAGLVGQVGDRLNELGLRRVGGDVEDVDLRLREPARPDEAAVVGEAHMVSLASGSDRHGSDHLPVALRLRVHVHGHQLVGAVPEPLDAQGPDVDVVFLTLDELGGVGRVAGLVGADRAGVDRARQGDPCGRQNARTHHALRNHRSLLLLDGGVSPAAPRAYRLPCG